MPPQTAILVGVALNGRARGDDSLDELGALALSSGLATVNRIVCRRARPDAALYVGSGKAAEIAQAVVDTKAQVVVFDNDLSPAQQRNLEQLCLVPVLDRTELILSIFARRANSHEGKLQVELARLDHQASRLKHAWSHLERQQGGVGVRGGPGEKQIELDRRMIEARIKRLRQELLRLTKQRQLRRRSRERRGVPMVSLVGYTNAGKSTLFNVLTNAGTYAADQLFATLDTLTRRVRLGDREEITASDTVGFIRDLPHTLVAAFRATLEETAAADLLLHVVDAASPEREQCVADVEAVLAEIGAGDVRVIQVVNKIDAAGLAPGVDRDACGNIERVYVSAITGEGIADLRRVLGEVLFGWPPSADADRVGWRSAA